jgi:hypothetical protein
MSRVVDTTQAAKTMSTVGSSQDSTYTLFGHSITVRWAPEPGQAGRERLDLLLAPYRSSESNMTSGAATVSVEGPSPDGVWTVCHDTIEDRFLGEDELLRQLERMIVASTAHSSMMPLTLHAGAVARDGKAVLLPGHSGSGKTTLTLSLAARGWLPLTDDICPCVFQEGVLFALPSPRCVHLSDATRQILGNQGIALEGPIAGLPGYYRPYGWGVPAPIRSVILPRYQPGMTTTLVPLTMAEVAAQVLLMRFEQDLLPREEQWSGVLQLARQAPGWRLVYSSLDEAFDVVEQLTQAGEVTPRPAGWVTP